MYILRLYGQIQASQAFVYSTICINIKPCFMFTCVILYKLKNKHLLTCLLTYLQRKLLLKCNSTHQNLIFVYHLKMQVSIPSSTLQIHYSRLKCTLFDKKNLAPIEHKNMNIDTKIRTMHLI